MPLDTESQATRLEVLLQVHLPHLPNGDSLFPEFDSYRLREHGHGGYLSKPLQVSKLKSVLAATSRRSLE